VNWREEFGMGVSGGPVRVQSQPGGAGRAGRVRCRRGGRRARARAEDDVEARATGAPRVADPGGGADVELNLDWD
jgi:hypothetical protein